jgi:regulatory protein
MIDDIDIALNKFYNLALRFLSYRIRSEKEVWDKLKEKQADPQVIEKIVSKLKDKKFINDENFARMWIENRSRFKPRSLRLIKLELKQKGIGGEIISKTIDDKGLMINDLEMAKELAERRIGKIKALPKQEIYEKLGRYLASKGFNWDTIKKSIDEVLGKGV